MSDQADGRLAPHELAAWRGMLRVHAALLRDLDADLGAAHGLTTRCYEVLLFLGDAPDSRLRLADLSRSVLLSASGVSRLVDRLERDGYVARERCADDGRGYFAVLTAAGAEKLKEARTTHLTGVRRLFLERFDAAELEDLARYWERILPGAGEPSTTQPAGD